MKNQNDYWEYLSHGQQGAQRADHKYYTRVPIGTNGGQVQYRYFYSKDEYAAYLQSKSGRKTYAEAGNTNDVRGGTASKKTTSAATEKAGSNWQEKKREREDRAARIRTGKKRLTGKHGSRIMDNGRTIYYAEQQYVDIDGKTKLRDKLIDRDEYEKMRSTDRARNKRLDMTDKEVKARSKAARKRYKKKTRLGRMKRSVQKATLNMTRPARKALASGAAYVSKLLGRDKKKRR